MIIKYAKGQVIKANKTLTKEQIIKANKTFAQSNPLNYIIITLHDFHVVSVDEMYHIGCGLRTRFMWD
jgi:type VI protein secretion system component Hcp